jgi:aerobic carbon-monoxide dehydrogenase medium subunit
MRLPPFDLAEPATLAEAVALLAGHAGECRVIAGGTALVPTMRLGLVRPDLLVSLHRIPDLDPIEATTAGLLVGALATHARLSRSRIVAEGWPLLAESAGRVASPAIRASGTVGGNLCYAEAASDVAPALLCLDAELEVIGASGGRVVPSDQFFRGFYEAALDPGEILTRVRVPSPRPGTRSGYVRFCPRAAEDKPLVGVAALLVLDRAGRCQDARIALGGAAPTPIRARRAEAVLRGAPAGEEAIRAAADAAAAEADPLDDLAGSAEYRRGMVRVWTRRLLTRLADRRRPPAARPGPPT